MALTRIGGANAITGTIPQGNIANASLGAVTALPAAITTGKVLNVVSASFTNQQATTSDSYTSTVITANITPTSSSSKIYCYANFKGGCAVSDRSPRYAIFRDSTNIIGSSSTEGAAPYFASAGAWFPYMSLSVLDAPTSSSQLTYVVKFRCQDSTSNTTYCGDNTGKSIIILMEIA